MSKELQKKQEIKAQSERFTAMVMSEFQGVVGEKINFSPEQKRLAQHLFIKVDASLKEAEAYRLTRTNKKNDPLIVWDNINLQKMAMDSIHRIELGLDALIENHISIIPYLNGKTKKYDLDLRIGYSGKDYYRKRFAIDAPERIIYQLVHENDELTFTPQDSNNKIESYTFKVPQPLKRGKVIGGFGYIVHNDPTKNKFIPVSMAEIARAAEKSQSDKFWGPYRDRMEFKTIVNIVTHPRNMPTDPQKVSESFYRVENDENSDYQKTDDIELITFNEPEQLSEPKKKVPDKKKKQEKTEKQKTDSEENEEIEGDFQDTGNQAEDGPGY